MKLKGQPKLTLKGLTTYQSYLVITASISGLEVAFFPVIHTQRNFRLHGILFEFTNLSPKTSQPYGSTKRPEYARRRLNLSPSSPQFFNRPAQIFQLQILILNHSKLVQLARCPCHARGCCILIGAPSVLASRTVLPPSAEPGAF